MTQEKYLEYIARVQKIQLRCSSMENIIFSMSISRTQVRAIIFTKIAPSRSFFLYSRADESEGDKMLARVQEYLTLTEGWKEATPCM